MTLAYCLTSEAIEEEQRRSGHSLAAADVSRVIRPERVELPSPGRGEVRVAVLAASVEHNVLHAALADTVDIVALRGGRMIPGNSFVGEVIEVGAEVGAYRAGDIVVNGLNPHNDRFGYPVRMWGFDDPRSGGAYAEQLVIPARQLRPAPLDCGLDLWQIAAAPVRAATAYHLWRRAVAMFRAKVPTEKLGRLNVLAFGGGTSECFLMLARAFGHRAFYCSANAARRARLAELGVESIEQERFQRFAEESGVRAFARLAKRLTGGEGMHVVCDMFRGPVFAAGLAAASREGVNVSAGWQLGMDVSFNSATLSLRQITVDHVHFETVDGCDAALELLGSAIRPLVHDEIYAFADLPRALQELHRNVQTGIPVVRVAERLPDSVRGLARES